MHANPTLLVEACEEVLGMLVEEDQLEAAAQFLNMMEDSFEHLNAINSGNPNVTDYEAVQCQKYSKLVEELKEIKKSNL